MRLLDPGRIGRVSMKPPLDKRYIPIYSYPRPRDRNIHPLNQDNYTFGRLCAWCERPNGNDQGQKYRCFPYRPSDYGFHYRVPCPGWPVAPDAKFNDIWCCCWACFDQWLNYHVMVVDEIELSLLFGVLPEYVPEWFMPRAVLASMCGCADQYRLTPDGRLTKIG